MDPVTMAMTASAIAGAVGPALVAPPAAPIAGNPAQQSSWMASPFAVGRDAKATATPTVGGQESSGTGTAMGIPSAFGGAGGYAEYLPYALAGLALLAVVVMAKRA